MRTLRILSANNARIKFLSEFKKHGNRHKVYRAYMKSDCWAALREAKLMLEPECEICGKEDNVEVYHQNYKYLYDCTLIDLETLCGRCKSWKFVEGLLEPFH